MFKKLLKLVFLIFIFTWIMQLYILQQTGKLKKPMQGTLTNVKTEVDVNIPEFSDLKIEEEINNFRQRNNLSKLTRYEPLCALANLRVEEIKTDWSHKGFEERNQEIYTKYCNKGALICTSAGENLAKGDFIDEKGVVNGWENSPDHKENMMGDYNVQCVAVSGKFYVSLFAFTQDTEYLKQIKQRELNSRVTYDYQKVIFWEEQITLNKKYKDSWENGLDNHHYDKDKINKLLGIINDKIEISQNLWDGITNSKISNQDEIDLENKYWELANKSAKISKQLNEDAYKECLDDDIKEDICKQYKSTN